MTTTVFLALLSIFAVLTSSGTEAVKKFLDSIDVNYNSNIIATILSIVIGLIGTFIYYEANAIELDLLNVIYAILMSLASALTAMLGYDKFSPVLASIIEKINNIGTITRKWQLWSFRQKLLLRYT